MKLGFISIYGDETLFSNMTGFYFKIVRKTFGTPSFENCNGNSSQDLANSNPVIMPYKVVNVQFIALYGKITGVLAANFLCAGYIAPFKLKF